MCIKAQIIVLIKDTFLADFSSFYAQQCKQKQHFILTKNNNKVYLISMAMDMDARLVNSNSIFNHGNSYFGK